MMRLFTFVTLLTALSFCAAAEEANNGKNDKQQEAPEAKQYVTEHEARVGGKKIEYTVTAGTMLMKNDKDEPQALIGYTAYVAKGKNRSERPIMFAYNGGPGSASIWLHMGILGPQRAVVTDDGFSNNGPYRRVNNEYSIIDETDLVMIDPVGTGFAKAVGEAKGEDFWGVDQDIKSISEFIVQYLTENGRWASPKYILGESYGGMRSGGVAYYLLENHFVALDGVVLVSPFMEFTAGFSGMGIDLPHAMFLPTFAATARYHGALDPTPPDLEKFLDEAADFALNEYAPALLKGDALTWFKRMKKAGVPVEILDESEPWQRAAEYGTDAEIIVDGLLGTGASGEPRGVVAEALRFIDSQTDRALIVAIDIPSAMAVRSDLTVTMGLPKSECVSPENVDWIGNLEVVDIGIPPELMEGVDEEGQCQWL